MEVANAVMGEENDDEITFLLPQDEIEAGAVVVRMFLIAVCIIVVDKQAYPEDAKRFLREDAVQQVRDRLEMAEQIGPGKSIKEVPIRVVNGFRGKLVFPTRDIVRAPLHLDELRHISPHKEGKALSMPLIAGAIVIVVAILAIFMGME